MGDYRFDQARNAVHGDCETGLLALIAQPPT